MPSFHWFDSQIDDLPDGSYGVSSANIAEALKKKGVDDAYSTNFLEIAAACESLSEKNPADKYAMSFPAFVCVCVKNI